MTLRAEQYNRLLDQGESMLLARGGEEAGPGTTQTQQNLAMLQNKWGSLNTKMDDRRVNLYEYTSLCFAHVFCSSFVNSELSKLSRQNWTRPFLWPRVFRLLCRTPSTG